MKNRRTALILILLAVVLGSAVFSEAALLLVHLYATPKPGPAARPLDVNATAAAESVDLVWVLPAGEEPVEAVQQAASAMADAYNRMSGNRLVLQIRVATDPLAPSAADADFYGPVDFSTASAMEGEWLDLAPYLEPSVAAPASASILGYYRRGSRLLGLPFSVDPTFLVYDKTVFDSAGLEYPPSTSSGRYTLKLADGGSASMPWDMAALARLARAATLDANGRRGDQAGFDPAHIVRSGLLPESQDLREWMILFGSGSWTQAEATAEIPAPWREAVAWYYRGMWKDAFIPNARTSAGVLADPGAFGGGRVALAMVHLRDLDRIPDGADWDLAPLPSYGGAVTSSLREKAFYLSAAGRHPREAFEAMRFLAKENWGGLPELGAYLPAWEPVEAALSGLRAKHPGPRNWWVVVEMLTFADSPSSLGALPGERMAREKLAFLLTRMQESPDLDLGAELDRLERELTAIMADAAR